MTQTGYRLLSRLPAVGGYGVAVLSVLAASALIVQPGVETAPGSALFCAVTLSAWRGGLRAGLLATGLSLVAFAYYLIAPYHSLAGQPEAIPRLLVFALAALFVCLLGAAQKRATQALGKARDDLADKVRELQQANQALQAENTERRRAEVLVRESEKRFRALIEHSSDAAMMFDAPGTILYVSPSVERILGFTPEEMVGQHRLVFIDPEQHDATGAVWARLLQEPGKSYTAQRRVRHKDGSWRWLEAVATNWLEDSAVRAVVGNLRDITERKHAEETLQASEKRFRALIEHSSDAAVMLDGQGKILYASPSIERLLGFAPEEMVGQHRLAFIDPEQHEATRAGFANLLREPGKFVTVQRRARHQDGSWRWLEVTATNWLNEPDVQAMVANLRDVTERKRAEESLQASEKRFRALIEHSSDAAIMLDAEGVIVYASPPIERLLGYTPEEMVGQHRLAFIDPGQHDETGDAFARVLREPGKFYTTQRRLRHKDGSWRWLEATATNWLNEPDVQAIVANLRDITERKQVEDALRESEQRFRDYAETTSDYLWETGPDHRFAPLLDKTIPADKSYWWGKRRWDYAADVEEEPEKWRRHIATLEARQPFRDFRFRQTRLDGSIIYTSTSGKPVFDSEGHFLGYRGGATDVTAAVRAAQTEQALQNAREALAHATRVTTLGELTASIAHEINQPLAAVVANASAGRRWLAAQPPNLDEARRALDRIVRDGNRASDIINRIRALLKKSAAPCQRLSINDTILEVVALTRSELQMNGVTLDLQLADDLPPVTGDRVQLQQVILNLIVNAIEAMRGLGTGRRELLVGSCWDGVNGVLVRVEDSGPGLDPSGIARLFDAFYTTKQDGMGMGLAISRSIIEAHGGRLWATPNVPKGATFHFFVPTGDGSAALSNRADATASLTP